MILMTVHFITWTGFYTPMRLRAPIPIRACARAALRRHVRSLLSILWPSCVRFDGAFSHLPGSYCTVSYRYIFNVPKLRYKLCISVFGSAPSAGRDARCDDGCHVGRPHEWPDLYLQFRFHSFHHRHLPENQEGKRKLTSLVKWILNHPENCENLSRVVV